MTTYDALILGAGAAGLMCAATAGQRGRRVLVIDHADQAGKKILISGGGRCNFTNIGTTPDRFLSANPHFARSALARYTPADFIALIEKHGIAWHEKTLGQLFCDGSAKQIVGLLLDECARGPVDFAFGQPIRAVEHGEALYRVTVGNRIVSAPKLVIATGGPSIPKMGASGLAYDLARQFRLKVVEPRPALVPLTFGADMEPFMALSGIAADVIVRCGKTAFREAALFTHRGLSGPAILQISSYWRHGQEITLDLAPDQTTGWLAAAKRANPRTTIARQFGGLLSDRLASLLAERTGLRGDLGNIRDADLAAAERSLSNWRIVPTGSEGFAKAEVTVGGVSTADLSSQTMEARKVPGLHVIGEAVDVTGWLGGYNFQWAWASGVAAGQAI